MIDISLKTTIFIGQNSFKLEIAKGGVEIDISNDIIELIPDHGEFSLKRVKDKLFPNLPNLSVSDVKIGYDRGDKTNAGQGFYLRGKLQLGENLNIGFPTNFSESENVVVKSSKSIESDLPALSKKINLNKSFGPVKIHGIGLSAEGFSPKFNIDLSFEIAGLIFSLLNLGASFPIDNFPNPKPSLGGLQLIYKNGPMEIGGSFLKENNKLGFLGSAIITTESFNITALGGFDASGSDPSFFLYAVYNKAMGGPSFFFVTGLAAGLGINRKLIIPPVNEIEAFPLIKAAREGSNEDALLLSLKKYLPAAPGNIWMAAGVKFTSFKLMETFALLSISVGDRLAIHLLGVSTVGIGTDRVKSVYAKMLLRAEFLPQEGFLGIEARLAPGSYVFQKSCELSGGFAFFQWFSGEHEGDFVLSWGGYHPAYQRPDYYPSVPRLAINWPITKELRVKGSAYMAITPGVLMAGGRLEAVWEKGGIRAWFNMEANFWIKWKPFQYEADFRVTIGATFRVKVLFVKIKMTISVNVDMRVWGPDFSGRAKINLKVISFTIPFGNSQKITPLSWESFRAELLPEELIALSVKQGLIKDLENERKGQKQNTNVDTDAFKWSIDPDEFKIEVKCAIPFDCLEPCSERNTGEEHLHNGVHINPAGITKNRVSSRLVFELIGDGASINIIPEINKVPKAMWGQPGEDASRSYHLLDAYNTILLSPKKIASKFTRQFDLDELLYDTKFNVSNESIWKESKLQFIKDQKVNTKDMNEINELKRKEKRKQVLECLHGIAGFDNSLLTPDEVQMNSLEHYEEGRFWDWPTKYKISDTEI